MIDGVHAILEKLNFNPNDFNLLEHYNKQKNGYDCGIFVILSLLYTCR